MIALRYPTKQIIPDSGSIVSRASISHSNLWSRTFQVVNKITVDNYLVICMVSITAAEIVLSRFAICWPDYWAEENLSWKSC